MVQRLFDFLFLLAASVEVNAFVMAVERLGRGKLLTNRLVRVVAANIRTFRLAGPERIGDG